MDFIQGIDWSTWIPQLGEHAVTFILLLGMTYGFLWLVLPMFAKYYDKVHLPFGVKLERDRSVDNILQQASSDAVVIQGIYETGENLEFQAREQMRRTMTKIVNKYMADNLHNPTYQEYLLRSRVTLSNAVVDNHIVYSLAKEKVIGYVDNKQEQVIDSIGVDISNDYHAMEMLKGLTKDFVGLLLPIQKKMCMEKIASYKRAFQLLQLDGNKALCQAKIDKNNGYLTAMHGLEHTHEYKSAIQKPAMGSDVEADGAMLIDQNINKTLEAYSYLEKEGKLDGTGHSSSVMREAITKPSKKGSGKRQESENGNHRTEKNGVDSYPS